jgi:hypothetical protein
MMKSFPPIPIESYSDIDNRKDQYFMLRDFLRCYTDYEENVDRFISICVRLAGDTQDMPLLSRVDNTTFQCSWEHYLTTDVHWIISFSMDFAKVDSYSVYFCRNNSCFTTEFNDSKSAEKLVLYLIDRVSDNAELWV